MLWKPVSFFAAAAAVLAAAAGVSPPPAPPEDRVLQGQGRWGDWSHDAPGVRHRITLGDLPAPYATKSVDNGPEIVRRPTDAWPKAPKGFAVQELLTGLSNPRLIRAAPNGDVFFAESSPGRIRVLRLRPGADKPTASEVFASGLDRPFGIAFYPPGERPRFVYVAETGRIVRFPYGDGDLKARGGKEVIVSDIPSGGLLRGGGHWTRDIAFSNDGKHLFVSVGSRSNDAEDSMRPEDRRADILEYNPDGTGLRTYASGIRNAVGIAIDPRTGQLWASVNERDGLGDDLVPDYVTRVQDGGFYGWPWFYIGPHSDPRHRGEHGELSDKVLVPDVLLQSHSASLEMVFETGRAFPESYAGDAFAAQHGSWNRSQRTGPKVIRILLHDGVPTGEYEDFLTGFAAPDGKVWGRPVGVAFAGDGSLLVTDDAANAIWRISYAAAEGASKRR